ncbi:MAG: asparagine synthase (glutamine-hydrolyzing) [Verrucomicrobia bacterium]|nr:MAG: asparagine synthase (glutamine-hydrolyzing) [Verrucomicrobiota bacterium]
MCGIAGIWGEANEELIRRMTETVSHRGPDDAGIEVFADFDPPISLGHRRLSIIDLSAAGHQPMANEDETLWIVFNGEIYNFPELRKRLLTSGHRFRSRTDTEVLIHGYEEWGIDFVKKLNGIFAFALWDSRRRLLHLVRDRYGVKPLYYRQEGKRLFFASEIKSLLCDRNLDREIDPNALLAYVKFRYCPEPLTLFKHVHRVPPGHVMTFGVEQTSSSRFYELVFRDTHPPADERDLARQLRDLLFDTVRRQMISDVPVGLFLSGGVDSGGLLAMTRNFSPEPLKTFTIGFRREDQRFEGQPDDVRYARELAKRFHTDHQEIILEPKIVDLLPKVIWHLDDPIADPAAITSYLICQAARQQNTKVLLSGQGGDEVFCGYPWHLAIQLSRYYDRLPAAVRALLQKLLNRLPAAKGGPLTATFRRLRKFNNSASLEFEDRLIGFLSYAYTENLHGLLGERYAEAISAGLPERTHWELLKKSARCHYIDRMLHLDMGTFLPSLNLAYTDKTSMAFGVEVRVPYIDNEIVDFMAAVPPDLKMRGTVRKYLMKQALKDLLPDQILNRQKAGFGAPIRTWIVSDLKEMIEDLLCRTNLERRGFFNPDYVQRLIQENASGRHDYNYLIYILLNFELWCRVHLDKQAP